MGGSEFRQCQIYKPKRYSNVELDRFGLLPDHIIISIFSRLSLRDAVKTSVLSRKWKKLWRLSIGTDLILCDDRNSYPHNSIDVRTSFKSWVDGILQSYKYQQVNEFAIRFNLDSCFYHDVKNWLVFALEKNVIRLHLDMVAPCNMSKPSLCVFPDLRSVPTLPPEFSNLKELCLCDFEIDHIGLDYLLYNCPSLERICLRGLRGWKRLNAAGTTLKCLEVVDCYGFEVVISAPNLVSFSYVGSEGDLKFMSFPLLSEFSFGGICAEFYVKQFFKHISLATQLTTLKFELSMKMVRQSMCYPDQELTVFNMLKYLEISMDMDEFVCLLWPICLIKAAPLLHKFKLKMRSLLDKKWLLKGESVSRVNEVLRWNGEKHVCYGRKTIRHKCLELVEFHGFSNLENQWELVDQIFKIGQSLRKMVLDAEIKRVVDLADINTRSVEIAERLVPGVKVEVRNSSTNVL